MNLFTKQLEEWVFSRLSFSHIMWQQTSTSPFVSQFKKFNQSKKLPLGSNGNSIPLCLRAQVGRRTGKSRECMRPRKGNGFSFLASAFKSSFVSQRRVCTTFSGTATGEKAEMPAAVKPATAVER